MLECHRKGNRLTMHREPLPAALGWTLASENISDASIDTIAGAEWLSTPLRPVLARMLTPEDIWNANARAKQASSGRQYRSNRRVTILLNI